MDCGVIPVSHVEDIKEILKIFNKFEGNADADPETTEKLIKELKIFTDKNYASEIQVEIDANNHIEKKYYFIEKVTSVLLNILEALCEANDLKEMYINSNTQVEFLKTISFIVKHSLRPCIPGHFFENEPQMSSNDFTNLIYKTNRIIIQFGEKSGLIKTILLRFLREILLSMLWLCFDKDFAKQLTLDKRKECLKWLNSTVDDWVPASAVILEVFIILRKTTLPWLKNKCSFILSQTLLKPNGLESFFRALKVMKKDQENFDWKFELLISDLLSTSPKKISDKEDYFKSVCSQILGLLQVEESENISPVLVNTIQRIFDKQQEMADRFILQPITKIFQDILCTGCIKLGELENFVEVAWKIVNYSGPNIKFLFPALKPYIIYLFILYLEFKKTPSYLTPKIKKILLSCIRMLEEKEKTNIFLIFCGHTHLCKSKVKYVRCQISEYDITFHSKENNTSELETLLQKQDEKVNAILCFLKAMNDSALVGSVFIWLVKFVCLPFIDAVEIPGKINTTEDKILGDFSSNEARLITFALITSLVETEEPQKLLSEAAQIIHFVRVTLENWLLSKDHCDSESVRLCFSVIGLVLMQTPNSAQRKELRDLLPVLQKLSTCKELDDMDIKELSLNVAMTITTLTGSTIDMKEQEKLLDLLRKPNNKNTKDPNESKPTLIEEITSNSCDATSIESPVDEMFSSLHDIQASVVGAAIRELTKLVKLQNPEVITKKEQLVEELFRCLLDDDVFVYISAVQGLAVIATSSDKGNVILHKLISSFQKYLSLSPEDDKFNISIDLSIKMGEILARAVLELGEMASEFASTLVPVYLQGLHHSCDIVKASLLSNLVQIIVLIPNSIRVLQFEISECLTKLSKHKDVNVRRAATFAIRHLVETLQQQFLQVLDSVALDLYKALKSSYERDDDEKVRLHAQLGLEKLDEFMKKNLFSKPQLQKKITILN